MHEKTMDQIRHAPSTLLLRDARYLDHQTGEHPEQPARLKAVDRALAEAGLLDQCTRLKPKACSMDQMLAVHSAEYIQTAQADVAAGRSQLSTGDTTVCPESMDIAMLAAGGVIEAVDHVVQRKAANAFCAVRPPGHHATPTRGMGFCLLNNVAMAARHAQKQHGIGRILIADWDVHHGNGTQDVFYNDETVFFFSTHQSPWYPGTGSPNETGKGKGLGTTLNAPFGSGAGRKQVYDEAFAGKLVDAMAKFKPELVILSAGFDSRVEDPLGQFRLSDDDFADLTKLMLQMADDHAGGRLVSVLEGGYNLEGLGKATAAHVQALVDHAKS